jgi:hypothetical protein
MPKNLSNSAYSPTPVLKNLLSYSGVESIDSCSIFLIFSCKLCMAFFIHDQSSDNKICMANRLIPHQILEANRDIGDKLYR